MEPSLGNPSPFDLGVFAVPFCFCVSQLWRPAIQWPFHPVTNAFAAFATQHHPSDCASDAALVVATFAVPSYRSALVDTTAAQCEHHAASTTIDLADITSEFVTPTPNHLYRSPYSSNPKLDFPSYAATARSDNVIANITPTTATSSLQLNWLSYAHYSNG
ncbi:hypothetical protein PMIN03_000053 [Paraphaeosphaeria minitans]